MMPNIQLLLKWRPVTCRIYAKNSLNSLSLLNSHSLSWTLSLLKTLSLSLSLSLLLLLDTHPLKNCNTNLWEVFLIEVGVWHNAGQLLCYTQWCGEICSLCKHSLRSTHLPIPDRRKWSSGERRRRRSRSGSRSRRRRRRQIGRGKGWCRRIRWLRRVRWRRRTLAPEWNG